jgi:trk system potassium uptake protein TrkH
MNLTPPTPTAQLRKTILLGCGVLMALAAAGGIAALALEYGFYTPDDVGSSHPGRQPLAPGLLHLIQLAVLGVFMLDRVLRLLLTDDRREYLRENWIDYALVAAAAVVAFLYDEYRFKVLAAATVYVIITQIYIVAALGLRVAGFPARAIGKDQHPLWVVVGAYLMVILFGAGLLMLPQATPKTVVNDENLLPDSIFTAVSAATCTGLAARDVSTSYTHFGQTVILVLVQLGGLGMVIFGTAFFFMAGGKFAPEPLLPEAAGAPGATSAGVKAPSLGQMLKFAVAVVFILEAVGAVLQYRMWRDYYEFLATSTGAPAAGNGQIIYQCVFHSVSALCNAGFSLHKANLGVVGSRWQTIGVIAPLIVLGGLGFPVLYNLTLAIPRRIGRIFAKRPALGAGVVAAEPLLTLHAKLVVIVTVVLIVVGAAGLIALEEVSYPGQTFGAKLQEAGNPYPESPVEFKKLPLEDQVREATFQSISARTGGFSTISVNSLADPSKLWLCLLMLIGGSPAGVAGGVKTVTLAVLVLGAAAALRRRGAIVAFGRTIPWATFHRAFAFVGVYLAVLVALTLIVAASMNGRHLKNGDEAQFIHCFLESVSAITNTGLSCGVTENLTLMGKIAVLAGMFLGRVGPLALFVFLTFGRPVAQRSDYPTDDVTLG